MRDIGNENTPDVWWNGGYPLCMGGIYHTWKISTMYGRYPSWMEGIPKYSSLNTMKMQHAVELLQNISCDLWGSPRYLVPRSHIKIQSCVQHTHFLREHHMFLLMAIRHNCICFIYFNICSIFLISNGLFKFSIILWIEYLLDVL